MQVKVLQLLRVEPGENSPGFTTNNPIRQLNKSFESMDRYLNPLEHRSECKNIRIEGNSLILGIPNAGVWDSLTSAISMLSSVPHFELLETTGIGKHCEQMIDRSRQHDDNICGI
jgi:hypothetical protein